MKDFFRRLKALTHKEFLELIRDRSSLLMGILMPMMLVFINGYGVSLDVYHSRVTVVMEDMSPTAHDVVSFLDGSEYFDPVYVTSMKAAVDRMNRRETEAILRVPPDFSSRLHQGDAQLQLLLSGIDTTTAMSIQGYVESGLAAWETQQLNARGIGMVSVESRIWYNDANSSTWYFMPGLIMLTITIIGVLLTAVIMAREYERGTFESLFVTPVRPMELILSKIIPYFGIACIGVAICFFLSRHLFHVPVHGFPVDDRDPVGDLPVRGPGGWTDHFRLYQEPVPGLPNRPDRDHDALSDALRLCVRPAEHPPDRPVGGADPAFQPLFDLSEVPVPGW